MWRAPTAQEGFTLIEVMVAAVVMAVGLLGVVALQLEALRTTRMALARTQAVALAADLADRIRAHPAPAQAYDCVGDCALGDGGDAQAAADLDDWLATVGARLPDGVAAVNYAAGSPAHYRIQLRWAEGGAVPAEHRLEVAVAAGDASP